MDRDPEQPRPWRHGARQARRSAPRRSARRAGPSSKRSRRAASAGACRRTATSPLSRENQTSSESCEGCDAGLLRARSWSPVVPGLPSETALLGAAAGERRTAAPRPTTARAARRALFTVGLLRRLPPGSLRLVLLVDGDDRARIGLQDADPEAGLRLEQPAVPRVLALQDLRELGHRDRGGHRAGSPRTSTLTCASFFTTKVSRRCVSSTTTWSFGTGLQPHACSAATPLSHHAGSKRSSKRLPTRVTDLAWPYEDLLTCPGRRRRGRERPRGEQCGEQDDDQRELHGASLAA